MNKRYNNIERLGVIEAEKIIISEINWIFREQPIVDVGIDAIIEEVVEGNPTGRLLATQIKTGKGNFYVTNKHLTYYMSNVHYSYWLGYVLPVLMFAYLPDEDVFVWEIISEETIKRARKKWKIEIPLNKYLNASSISQLTNILDLRFSPIVKHEPFTGDTSTINIYNIIENVNYIADATESTLRLIEIINKMRTQTNVLNKKINIYVNRKLSKSDKEVVASINKFAKDLLIISKQIEAEISIFSEMFGIGVSAYAQVTTIFFKLTKDSTVINETKDGFNNLYTSLINAESGIQFMQESIKKLPNDFPKLKYAKKILLESVNLIIDEYNDAKFLLNINKSKSD